MQHPDASLDTFLDELASRAPVPGGGSASAIVGSIAAALCGMVGRLNDKKDGTPGKLHDTIPTADALRQQLRGLSNADIAAFSKLMETWKLPEDPQSVNQKQDATILATETPLEIMSQGLETLRLALEGLRRSKKGCLSDAGVAAFLAHAAIEGARLNVMINLPGIRDEAERTRLRERADGIRNEASTLRAEADRIVDEKYA